MLSSKALRNPFSMNIKVTANAMPARDVNSRRLCSVKFLQASGMSRPGNRGAGSGEWGVGSGERSGAISGPGDEGWFVIATAFSDVEVSSTLHAHWNKAAGSAAGASGR